MKRSFGFVLIERSIVFNKISEYSGMVVIFETSSGFTGGRVPVMKWYIVAPRL